MKDFEKIVKACEKCTSSPGCEGCPYENEECYDTFKKDVLGLITEMKARLEQPVQINEVAMQSHSEEIRKLNDELCRVNVEYERTQRELYEAQKELTTLRAIKATAEAFLGVKIDGQM